MGDGAIEVAAIVGSLRARSFNRGLFEAALALKPAEMRIRELTISDLPHCNEDVEREGDPSSVRVLKAGIEAADALLFVTPEYNHSTSAALKNALDFLFAEWRDKAVGFVGYGGSGGTRAVEHLRLVAGELGMADVRAQVALRLGQDFAPDGTVRDDPGLEQALHTMLDEVVAWSGALAGLRATAA